jgi:hypothetical protein
MKTCAYCGHENEDAADFCVGCGTNEFKESRLSNASPASSFPKSVGGENARDKFKLRVLVVACLSIAILYAPSILASLLTHDRWAEKLAKVKFWPTLPGVGLLLMVPRPRFTKIGSAFATSALGLVMFAWMVRFGHRPAVAVVPPFIVSLIVGVFVYGGFAM